MNEIQVHLRIVLSIIIEEMAESLMKVEERKSRMLNPIPCHVGGYLVC